LRYVEMIGDKGLQEAVRGFLLAHRDKVEVWPASLKYHHTERGGLLRHTLEVCEISLGLMEMPLLRGKCDRDHVLAAAILHDLGKIHDYAFHESDERAYFVYNNRNGRGIHHALNVILDFQQETGYVLPKDVCKMVLSHEGGWSRTSAYPNFLGAALVSASDLISSRIDRLKD